MDFENLFFFNKCVKKFGKYVLTKMIESEINSSYSLYDILLSSDSERWNLNV